MTSIDRIATKSIDYSRSHIGWAGPSEDTIRHYSDRIGKIVAIDALSTKLITALTGQSLPLVPSDVPMTYMWGQVYLGIFFLCMWATLALRRAWPTLARAQGLEDTVLLVLWLATIVMRVYCGVVYGTVGGTSPMSA